MATAKVTLAEIPFVSLRHGLPQTLLSGHASFGETVAAAQAALAPPELIIDLDRRLIRASGTEIELPPAELALLAVFARMVIAEAGALPAPSKGVPDPAWAKRFLREYRTIVGALADTDVTEHALRHGMDGEYFSSRKSKLEKRLKAALGPAAAVYRIDSGNQRPGKYRLTLAPEAVTFIHKTSLGREIR